MPDPATVVVERVAEAVARLYPDMTDALDGLRITIAQDE